VESGKLLLLSSYEADLIHSDSTGRAVTSVFVVDQNTKGVAAVAKGDTVNVLYLADGSSRRALIIRVLRSSNGDKGFSGEVGGVARLERPAPAGSLTAADATSLKKELEASFGISDETGAAQKTAAVVLRSHQLLASTSSSQTPWNIYVDGDLETSVAATPGGEIRHDSGYEADLKLKREEPSYMVAGDRLRLLGISVTGNEVLLTLAASSNSNKLIYSTLAFPIAGDSSAKLIEQQIAAMLQATPSR
jgi:hypothetical protein